MGLAFILGRAGSGKTAQVLAEAVEELARHPEAEEPGRDGGLVVLLVPEQATYLTERALLLEVARRLGRRGYARARVVSFQRLAWLVATKLGGEAVPPLGEIGRRMALRALLARRRDELRLFGRVADRPGFVAKLSATLAELAWQGVGAADLRAARAQLSQGPSSRRGGILAAKLDDLALILEAYEAYLAEGRRDSLGRLATLAARIPEAEFLRGARVWVDGFAGFTGEEYAVLAALLRQARSVRVALCLDPEALPPEGEPVPDSALFHPTITTYRRLADLARELGATREADVRLAGRPAPRFRSRALRHLERELFSYPGRPAAAEGGAAPGDAEVRLVRCPDRRAEVEAAAREIRRLVRKGWRCREIAVVVRETEAYRDLVRTVFADYAIPVFVDARRGARHHPLVEALLSAVAAAAEDLAYEPVFRFLKTDLARASREEVDLLENYVLEFGIGGEKWRDPRPWTFRRRFTLEEDEPEPVEGWEAARLRRVNEARPKAVAPLLAYAAAAGRGRLAVARHVELLRSLLASVGAWETVEAWAERAEAEGDLESAQEHRQVREGVEELLAALSAHLADFEVTAEELGAVLTAGVSALTVGLIPPGLDQVTVGSVERSRHPDVRAAFVLGATEDAWPKPAAPDVIFGDDEREALSAVGLELGETARLRSLHEQYLAYVAVTRPSERLWVSRPESDDEGRRLSPAHFVRRIARLLPGVREERIAPEDESPWEAEVPVRFAEALARSLGPRPDEAPRAGADEVAHLLTFAEARRELFPGLPALVAAARYRNRPERIDREAAEGLFGPGGETSITRLESFAACPFQHFARYGLGLRPRARQRLAAPDVGVLYHAALAQAARKLRESGRSLADLERGEVAALAAEVVSELAPRLQNEILARSGRMRYMRGAIERALAQALEVLGRHALWGRFRPVAWEAAFGSGAGAELPGLALTLPGGRSLRLRGRIDRVEAAEGWDGRRLVRVVDFKSSRRRLDLNRALLGLALQLGLYLLAAVEGAPRLLGDGDGPVVPAGLLYLTVEAPFVRARPGMTEDAISAQRLKRLRAEGWVLADADSLEAADRRLEGELVPVRAKADGSLDARSHALAADEMQALLEALRREAARIAEAALAGEVTPSPYVLGRTTPCELCELRPVCQFDPEVDGFEYRRLPRRSAEDVRKELRRMAQEGGGGR
ncbi:MAG: exodeoxyribonuclease V subunit gamma [Clostridia bacterium]|nr:exodeoxyribonuclease V subunit gamma [Clostridia bacterium]